MRHHSYHKVGSFFRRNYKSGFLGLGSNPAPPPPVPNANTSAAAVIQQQAMHSDPNGVTYASTLLTGAATPANAPTVQKSVLLGGN